MRPPSACVNVKSVPAMQQNQALLFGGSADRLGFFLQIFRGEFPVQQLAQHRFQVFGPRILVVEIIGVLPDIDGEQAIDALRHRGRRIGGFFHRELAVFRDQPGPARAELFLAGFPKTSSYLDVTGTGQWTPVAERNVADRTMGSAVMYAPGKILYAGGGDPPTASAEVIDLNQASPSWRSVPGMAFARRQTNATILADGSVLITGGTSGPGFNSQAGAVHVAELWNPQTESWTTMASESKNRTYHGTALLLPSGQVLSSGSGEGGGIPFANSEFSAQVFSPPYLFKSDGSPAARPTITSAPSVLSYGQSFTVQTPEAASVSRGTLIRLSSVTHAFNMSQLIYPLTFAASGSAVSATAPPNATVAPPGPYMLFLINGSGTPSVAKIIMVGP